MAQDTPIVSTRDRYLAILVGVVAGYVLGRLLEAQFGWTDVGIYTMPLGGVLAGVAARFALARFREPSNDVPRRTRR